MSKQILRRTHTPTQWQTKLARDRAISPILNENLILKNCIERSAYWVDAQGVLTLTELFFWIDFVWVGQFEIRFFNGWSNQTIVEIVGSRFYSLKKFFWFPRWLSKSATTQESKIIFKSPGPPCPSFLMCSKLLRFNYVQLHLSPRGWSSIACSSAISSCRKGCHWTWTLHVLHLHSVAWQWSVNACETLPFPLVALYICLLQQMPSWKTLEIVLYSSVVLVSHKPS